MAIVVVRRRRTNTRLSPQGSDCACVCERKRGDVCGVFLHVCVGVWRCFSNSDIIKSLQNDSRVLSVISLSVKAQTTIGWLDFVHQCAGFLCFCVHMVAFTTGKHATQ